MTPARITYQGRNWDRPNASHSRRESAQFATWEQPRRIAINWRELAGVLALIVACAAASITLITIIHGGK